MVKMKKMDVYIEVFYVDAQGNEQKVEVEGGCIDTIGRLNKIRVKIRNPYGSQNAQSS